MKLSLWFPTLLDLELLKAPTDVKEHLRQYSADKFERVELTEEAIQLADAYINEKVSANQVWRIAGTSPWRQLTKLMFWRVGISGIS